MLQQPLIVTAQLDTDSFVFFDALRQRHFPPERNFLSAHLTLFHSLPADQIDEVSNNLQDIASMNDAVEIIFTGWRLLGRGVAMNVESPGLADVRAEIARRWEAKLTPQDRQPFRPHITIQNKVEPQCARSLLTELVELPHRIEGLVTGLRLSRYLNGHWETVDTFAFRSEA